MAAKRARANLEFLLVMSAVKGGEKAHHLLHTGYKKLDVYKFES